MKLKKWMAILLAAALVLSAMPDQRWTVSAEETEQKQEIAEKEKPEGEELSGENEQTEMNPTADDGQRLQRDPSIEEEQTEEEDLTAEEEQTQEKDPLTKSLQDSEEDPEGKDEEQVTDPTADEEPVSSATEDGQEEAENPEVGETLLEKNAALENSNALQVAPAAEDTENIAQEEAEEPEALNELSEEDEAGEPAAQAGDIASGTDGNISWVIDADGKLTVNGRGDYSSWTAPWDSYRNQIMSAEINVNGMADASCLFSDCENLKRIDLNNFDTTNITNMSRMFSGCSSLVDLNLSNFDTGNVTDMGGMFVNCSNLESLDLSSFQTDNVTDMDLMFGGCSNLKSCNLSSFNTGSVIKMNSMFEGCFNLADLNIDGFNTSNVTDMASMFRYCHNLADLDLSHFNTTNVTKMFSMFEGCNSLTNLNVSNFDTGNVTHMGGMFMNCSSLTDLDVSSFDTSNVTDMTGMFVNCSGLTNLNISNFNTGKVTNMEYMFSECSSLTELDLHSFDTANVTDMGNMFGECHSLENVNLSSFNTEKVTDMLGMFINCSSLTNLSLRNFNTANVEFMMEMFCNCTNLINLDLSHFDTESLYSMRKMFSGCTSLEKLDLSSFNIANVQFANDMFLDCNSLLEIHTPYNIKTAVSLPLVSGAFWLLPDGTEVTELPQNLDHSIVITRHRNPKIITTTPDLNMSDVIRVKYVPYSYTVETDNWDETNKVTYSLVSGKLAEGLNLYPDTGEIYGIPLEAGEFPIRVKAEFSNPEYLPSYADLTLTVLDNSDDNVFVASDPGYEVEQHLGTQIFSAPGSSDYYYAVQERSDQLFVSAGENGEFIALWLNGKKLTEGEDFTRESGSTRITVRSQTLENKTNKNSTNTIAAEFRVGGNPRNDLKRTAQNFRIDFQSQGSNSGGDRHPGGGRSGRSGSGGGSEEEMIAVSSATAVVHLVDAAGNPLTGAVLELHSTPQTAHTNQRGVAVFGGVTEGLHTLYVKDGSDNILASRNFELLFGENASINGDQVTVKAGAAFTFQVQMSGSTLLFLKVQEGDVYQVISADTSDALDPELWLALLLLSGGLGICMCEAGRKKKWK